MEKINVNKNSVLVFRILLSLIFLVAGFNHLLQPEKVSEKLDKAMMGDTVLWIASPQTLVLLAGAGLLIGGLALLLGLRTKWAALLLIAIIIPISISTQIGNPEGLGPLFKNVGLLGGLIFFFYNPSIAIGLDNLFKKEKLIIKN